MTFSTQSIDCPQPSVASSPLASDWTHEEVRDELRRILRSPFFIKSIRLSSFLSTAVEYLLSGKGDCFKEYIVGTEVYGRSTIYDPTQDTIVRTEARRLRSKLKEYYAAPHARQRVRISLISGSYVPVIECGHSAQFVEPSRPNGTCEPAVGTFPLALAVACFQARTAEPDNEDLASLLEEELTHELAKNTDFKVFRTSVSSQSPNDGQVSHRMEMGIQFALRGYVRHSTNGPVAQLQLTTLQGMILWSERFGADCLQDRSHEIASAVCTAFRSSTGRSTSGELDGNSLPN